MLQNLSLLVVLLIFHLVGSLKEEKFNEKFQEQLKNAPGVLNDLAVKKGNEINNLNQDFSELHIDMDEIANEMMKTLDEMLNYEPEMIFDDLVFLPANQNELEGIIM